MSQQVYVLRKLWPNIPDRIVQCTADLYRIYSCRRFLFYEGTFEPSKPAAEKAEATPPAQDGTISVNEGQEQFDNGNNGQHVLSPLIELSSEQTSATIPIPMPTFVLSSASPEPHDVQLRSDSITSIKMTPPPPVLGKPVEAAAVVPDRRTSTVSTTSSSSLSRRTSSLKSTTSEISLPDFAARRRSSINVQQLPVIFDTATPAPSESNKPSPSTTLAVDTLAFAHITGMLMEVDDLATSEKVSVLKLLIKSRIYERIVTKALCKAKLFEEIKEDDDELQPSAEGAGATNKKAKENRPPVPARAPDGAIYKDTDFYMFAILALYYFECGFVVRPQPPEEPKIDTVQMARSYIKNARISICAAFAKLHIGAQVPTVAKMLTQDEQKKLVIDDMSAISPREGLVYLFLPEEFREAQLYLFEQMGSEYLKDHLLSKNAAAAVEEAAAAAASKSNIVSVFSRQPESDFPRPAIGTSFLPREKNFRFAFVIPSSCISRQILIEQILIDQQMLVQKQTTLTSETSLGSKAGTFGEEMMESLPSQQILEKQGTNSSEKMTTGREGATQSAGQLSNHEVTNVSLAPIGVRINYRCQDRFSAFALYAAVNFLPTAHAGQTSAPIMPTPGTGETDIPLIPISLVVTGLTAPNQLSGLIRMLHNMRLSGPLLLGALESIFVYGLATLSKTAHTKLAAIAAEPATSEIVRYLELYDEEFTTESLDDERFRSVKVALAFGDVAGDVDFVDEGPSSYSSSFFDQPTSQNHPLTKANSGAIIDAVCFASESSHFVWLCATPTPIVKPAKPKPGDEQDGEKSSPVPSEGGRSHRSSMFPGSEDEDAGSDTDSHASVKHYKGKGKLEKGGGKNKLTARVVEDKKGGKSSLAAPVVGKGGKKNLQMPYERDTERKSITKDRRVSLFPTAAGTTSKLLGQRAMLDAKMNVTGSRSSLASQGHSSPSPAPPKFSASLKPNSMSQKLYQATLHAAKLPQIQTIVVALRNAHSNAFGEQFIQSAVQEINEINVVTAAPKITITAETPAVAMLQQEQQQQGVVTTDTTTTMLHPPGTGHHAISGGTDSTNTAPSDQSNLTTPANVTVSIVEPPRPTHRISSQLQMVPVPLSYSEIMAFCGAKEMLSKEETGKTLAGSTHGISKEPWGYHGSHQQQGLTVATAITLSAVSPVASSVAGEAGAPITGIYFDPTAEISLNNFVFGGYMAAMSITRVPVNQKQAAKGKRPQQLQPVRQVSAHLG